MVFLNILGALLALVIIVLAVILVIRSGKSKKKVVTYTTPVDNNPPQVLTVTNPSQGAQVFVQPLNAGSIGGSSLSATSLEF